MLMHFYGHTKAFDVARKTKACSPNYCDIVICQVDNTERALRFVEIKVKIFEPAQAL